MGISDDHEHFMHEWASKIYVDALPWHLRPHIWEYGSSGAFSGACLSDWHCLQRFTSLSRSLSTPGHQT